MYWTILYTCCFWTHAPRNFSNLINGCNHAYPPLTIIAENVSVFFSAFRLISFDSDKIYMLIETISVKNPTFLSLNSWVFPRKYALVFESLSFFYFFPFLSSRLPRSIANNRATLFLWEKTYAFPELCSKSQTTRQQETSLQWRTYL